MANQLPSGIISDVTVTENIPVFKTKSLDGRQRIKHRGIHFLSGSFDVTFEDVDDVKAWRGFIVKSRGGQEDFNIDLPMHFKTDVPANPVTLGSVGIGATSCTITGAFAGTIPAGSYFTLPNDKKVYVTEDDITTGSTFNFFPGSHVVQPSGSAIEFINPVITAQLEDNNQEIDYASGDIVVTSINWREVW